MQKVGSFQSREAWRKRRPRSNMPTCADHAHARCRTELRHFLANATGADNTDGLVPDDYGIVSLMIEKMAPLVSIAQVQTAGKVKKACQHISAMGRLFVSPREVVTKTSAPQRSVSRKLLAPAGSSWTHFRRGARALKSFSGGQPISTTSAAARARLRSGRLVGRVFPGAEIAIHRPLRPSGAQFPVEPSPGIDDIEPAVNVLNALQDLVRDLRNHQDINSLHDSYYLSR